MSNSKLFFLIIFSITLLSSIAVSSLEPAEAKRSQGVANPVTLSKQVCGDRLCEAGEELTTEEKIGYYLLNFVKVPESTLTQQSAMMGMGGMPGGGSFGSGSGDSMMNRGFVNSFGIPTLSSTNIGSQGTAQAEPGNFAATPQQGATPQVRSSPGNFADANAPLARAVPQVRSAPGGLTVDTPDRGTIGSLSVGSIGTRDPGSAVASLNVRAAGVDKLAGMIEKTGVLQGKIDRSQLTIGRDLGSDFDRKKVMALKLALDEQEKFKPKLQPRLQLDTDKGLKVLDRGISLRPGVIPDSSTEDTTEGNCVQNDNQNSQPGFYLEFETGLEELTDLIHPHSLVVDDCGNIFHPDVENETVVVFNPQGQQILEIGNGKCNLSNSDYTGSGYNCMDPDGSGPHELGDGQFGLIQGIAIGNSRIYVTDGGSSSGANHRIQIFDLQGNFLGKFGSYCSINPLTQAVGNTCVDPDGTGPLNSGDGQFNGPYAITIDQDGKLYVLDMFNRRIQTFDQDGNFLGFFASDSVGGGKQIDGILEKNGKIFVLEGETVYKIDLNGNILNSVYFRGFEATWPTYSTQHKDSFAVDDLDNVYFIGKTSGCLFPNCSVAPQSIFYKNVRVVNPNNEILVDELFSPPMYSPSGIFIESSSGIEKLYTGMPADFHQQGYGGTFDPVTIRIYDLNTLLE